MKMKRLLFQLPLLLSVLGLSFLAASANAEEARQMATRQVLLKKEVSLPSNQVQTTVIRVQFPSGYKTPLHTHEGPGPRYVLKGKLRVEDGGESHVYGSGDVFWETGEAMTVENIGGSDAEIVIFELSPTR
jgi:quercetin dioxygenase-like cupin family protein